MSIQILYCLIAEMKKKTKICQRFEGYIVSVKHSANKSLDKNSHTIILYPRNHMFHTWERHIEILESS
jgi:hypothetical protein